MTCPQSGKAPSASHITSVTPEREASALFSAGSRRLGLGGALAHVVSDRATAQPHLGLGVLERLLG